MNTMLCLLCGVLTAISIYLLLSPQLPRWLFGSMLLASTINLIIFLVGRVDHVYPAFIRDAYLSKQMSNPLPQALVLTAIVIGFGLLAFSLALIRKMNQLNFSLLDTESSVESTHD